MSISLYFYNYDQNVCMYNVCIYTYTMYMNSMYNGFTMYVCTKISRDYTYFVILFSQNRAIVYKNP